MAKFPRLSSELQLPQLGKGMAVADRPRAAFAFFSGISPSSRRSDEGFLIALDHGAVPEAAQQPPQSGWAVPATARRSGLAAKGPPRASRRDFLGIAGSMAVEFALTAPILIGLVAGIADFGMLTARTAAIAGATRVGAEYARNNSVRKADVQATSCITGIKNAMQNTEI